MRRFNGILAMIILVLFLVHAVMGSFLMIGFGDNALKFVAKITEGLIYIHLIIGVKYTVDTIRAQRKSGVSYFKENKLFWVRRISGLAIMIFLITHFSAFKADGDFIRLAYFDIIKLTTQILLVASIAVHVISNVKPALITFGIKSLKDISVDILLVLSILLAFMGLAFVIYYLRWNLW